MALLETVTISIGTAIAKRMVKTWLGDSISNDLTQLLLGKTEKKLADLFNRDREAGSRIERLAEQVVVQMTPFLEQEARDLDQGTRTAVILAVGEKLTQAKIDAGLIIQQRLDAEKLAQHLLEDQDHATREFPEGAELYGRLLREISSRIIKVATEMGDYDRMLHNKILSNQDRIWEQIDKQQTEMEEDARRFERKYRHAVTDELNRFEQFGIPRVDKLSSSQSLDMAYVTLSATIPVYYDTSVDENGYADMKVDWLDDSPNELMAAIRKERSAPSQIHSGTINQILSRSRRFVIRGQAGSGKSTLLQWLAIRTAQSQLPSELNVWNECVPFFIRLRERVDKGFPQAEAFIEPIGSILAITMPAGWVTDLLDRGQALILIDGVDELPAEQRDDMFRALRQLARDYPFAHYIVTSRPAAIKEAQWPEWQEWVKKERFVDAILQPMTLDDIDHFIDRWHLALKDAISDPVSDQVRCRKLETLPDNLKRLLRNRQPLRRLADNPLLCAMICALHEDREDGVPVGRRLLYQDCVDMLLNRRDPKRGVASGIDYPLLEEENKLFLVQQFAYWMLRNDYSDVAVGRADQYFDKCLADHHIQASDQRPMTGKDIRGLLVERASLLHEPSHGRIAFAHRTFLEYSAAQAIFEEGDIGVLLQNAHNDLWRETIILAAGEANKPSRREIIQGLLDPKDEKHRKKFCLLAVACLETMTSPADELYNQIMAQATTLIPPQDEDDVALIAKAGTPAIVLLHFNPNHTNEEMARCVQTLARIGSHQAMQAIRAYVTSDAYNTAPPFRLEYSLVRAVGAAWFDFDWQEYLEKILVGVTHLVLTHERVNDISALSSLPDLRVLDLSSTQVSDISTLSFLPNLHYLYLNATQVSDIEVLSSLLNLQALDLHSTQVRKISALSSLPNLRYLNLHSTQVSDISSLSSLPNLQHLDLSSTQVSDISAVEKIEGLRIVR